MHPSHKLLAILVILAALTTGCGKDTPTAPTVTPVSLTIGGNLALTDRRQQSQLTATLNLSDGSSADQTLATTWTSSNPLVATITGTGMATSISPGATQITATHQSFTDTKTLFVTVLCETNNTAFVSVGNRSATTVHIILLDGVEVVTLSPGETSNPYEVAAGVGHMVDFRIPNSPRLACAPFGFVPTRCSDKLITCSGPDLDDFDPVLSGTQIRRLSIDPRRGAANALP